MSRRPGSTTATAVAPASAALFERALAVTPGGVNSPVRAFRSVGGTPRFMASGSGAWITDADGNRLRRPGRLLGADDPRARPSRGASPRSPTAASRGLSFGTPGEGEVLLAEEIVARVRAGGPGAAGVVRHGGDDVGDPAGPRLHRPVGDHQVRRLLPRARRRAARRRRFRASPPSRCPTRPA